MEQSGETPESYIVNDLLALMEMNSGDELLPEVGIKEEMVVEVMHELWKEINTCYTDQYNFNFSQTPASFPMPVSFSDVGGDNERCGAVISAMGSTVMAGVGMGPTNGFSGEEMAGNGVVEGRDLCCGCSKKQGGGKMDGCDGGEFDDDWLTRVLSVDPQEFADLVVDPMIGDALISD